MHTIKFSSVVFALHSTSYVLDCNVEKLILTNFIIHEIRNLNSICSEPAEHVYYMFNKQQINLHK